MEERQKLKRKKEENSTEEKALEDQNAKRAITYQTKQTLSQKQLQETKKITYDKRVDKLRR